MIKVVATIGLLVAIPALAVLIFGNEAINQAPGLAPQPVAVYQFLGVAVTLDQVIVYVCVVVTVVAGALILRYTDVGLKVRAMVDSPAMTDLSGTNPTSVSVGVWAVSTFFAGLAGVLAAPIIGLDPGKFTAPHRGLVCRRRGGAAAEPPRRCGRRPPHGHRHVTDRGIPAAVQLLDHGVHRRGARSSSSRSCSSTS